MYILYLYTMQHFFFTMSLLRQIDVKFDWV